MKKYTKEELFKMDAVDVYKLVLQGKYIKTFPRGFWQQPEAMQNAIKCTKFLIEDMLKLTDDELKANLSQKLFYNNKLRGMLKACFEESIIKAIISVYPEKGFKPWEFNQVSPGYWNKETAIESVKWLIEKKLQLNDEQLKEQLNFNLFKDNGLGGMLNLYFNDSPINAVIETYPEKDFKPWEFKTPVPNRYWNEDTAIESIHWLIETKLGLTEEELKEQLSVKLFKDNGLGGMLIQCFDGSIFKAIHTAYPNRFKDREFKNFKYYK